MLCDSISCYVGLSVGWLFGRLVIILFFIAFLVDFGLVLSLVLDHKSINDLRLISSLV